MTKGSVCVCVYAELSVRESSHHFAGGVQNRTTKELTSHPESSDQDQVELLQSFFKAVESLLFFFIFVVLIADLVLWLLLESCTTALLVVAPVEELHGCGRNDNAHRHVEENGCGICEIVVQF